MTDVTDVDDACAHALDAVLRGANATTVVPATLRAHGFDAVGRATVARRVYGASVLRRRLAFLAGASDARALLHAYVQTVEHGEAVDAAWPADPIARLALEHSVPDALAARLVRDLGVEGATAFVAACNRPAPAHLRTNTLKTDRESLRARLQGEGIATAPHPACATALVVSGHTNLFGSAAWRDGLFEVQDAGSQALAALCDAKPGDTVVDLCAGRGGKTLALAAQLEGQGHLYAFDVDDKASACRPPRLRRAGVVGVIDGLPAAGGADVVLVDAPCSSLGTLRRSPDLRFTLDADALERHVPVQRALLAQAASLCRIGGRVIYATCSILPAENAAVARAAVDGLVLVDERAWWPQKDDTDGFYAAVFTRQ